MQKILNLVFVSSLFVITGCQQPKYVPKVEDINTTVLKYEKALFHLDYDEVKARTTRESLAAGTAVVLSKLSMFLSKDEIASFKEQKAFIDDYIKQNPKYLRGKFTNPVTIILFTSQDTVDLVKHVSGLVKASTKFKKRFPKEVIDSIHVTKVERLTPTLAIVSTKNTVDDRVDKFTVIKVNGAWKVVVLAESERLRSKYRLDKRRGRI